MKEAKVDASACAECGRCEEACPQNLPVARHLKEVREFFEAQGSSEVRP
ncbi:MAG: 4Fe-4S binding protein [Bacillota bacterium]